MSNRLSPAALAAIRARAERVQFIREQVHYGLADESYCEDLLAQIDALEAALAARDDEWCEDDKAIPEDEAIAAAFPTRIGRHDLYMEAARLVGANRSKCALVALVNWLLAEREKARAKLIAMHTAHGVLITKSGSYCPCGEMLDADGHCPLRPSIAAEILDEWASKRR